MVQGLGLGGGLEGFRCILVGFGGFGDFRGGGLGV